MARAGLTTYDLHILDHAVAPLRKVCSSIYLVGSVETSKDFRDVDVRMIMDDEQFDLEFGNPDLWQVFCLGVTAYLRSMTGLPIDFQVQRQTEANAMPEQTTRNHLSGGRRRYAALGDGTPYAEREVQARLDAHPNARAE